MRHPYAFMIPPTIPELVARAAEHPFLGEHLVMGQGVHHDIALAQFDGHRTRQRLRADLRYQRACAGAVAVVGGRGRGPVRRRTRVPGRHPSARAAPFDVFDPFDRIGDDQELVALDRMSRALHAINFFGAQRHGLLFLRVHERLLKSVKYDHGRHFSTVLMSFGLNPSRVVIELPAAAVAHKTFLGYLTKSYQHYGFKVAGNLSNAGQILSVSETARLDFIKMDAGTALRDAMVKPLVGYANRLRIPLIFNRVMDEAQFDRVAAVRRALRARAVVHGALSRPGGLSSCESVRWQRRGTMRRPVPLAYAGVTPLQPARPAAARAPSDAARRSRETHPLPSTTPARCN